MKHIRKHSGWRYRLLLTTLVILVILVPVYTFCWTVTVAWGIRDVCDAVLEEVRRNVPSRSTRLGYSAHPFHGKPWPWEEMPWYYVEAKSPVAFVVVVDSGWMREPLVGGGEATAYLWFFGHKKELRCLDRWVS